jgi:hypothetical protein
MVWVNDLGERVQLATVPYWQREDRSTASAISAKGGSKTAETGARLEYMKSSISLKLGGILELNSCETSPHAEFARLTDL